MGKKNTNTIAPWILFLICASLLCSGWLMRPFPIFIFLGIAPLFAITDQLKHNNAFWINIEFILLALVTNFFAAHHFAPNQLVISLAQAIVMTVSFLGYSFAHQQLGNRLSKFTILFFWLGLEYLLLKLPWRSQMVFLADSMELLPKFTAWTYYTGYLGISLWILLAGMAVYMAVFRTGINAYWMAASVVVLLAPAIYSQYLSHHSVNHSQMIALYETGQATSNRYVKEGELVSRTAAWISVVILLLALVKSKIKK
jgi:hypothetical protein